MSNKQDYKRGLDSYIDKGSVVTTPLGKGVVESVERDGALVLLENSNELEFFDVSSIVKVK